MYRTNAFASALSMGLHFFCMLVGGGCGVMVVIGIAMYLFKPGGFCAT